MTTGTERYSSSVDVPEMIGRLDPTTAHAMKALAEDTTLSPEGARRERNRIIDERRRQQATERERRRNMVERLAADVAAAIRKA